VKLHEKGPAASKPTLSKLDLDLRCYADCGPRQNTSGSVHQLWELEAIPEEEAFPQASPETAGLACPVRRAGKEWRALGN
jgi:hypothetical protein